LGVAVLVACGVTEDFKGFAGEVDDPDFGDAGFGVEGDFDLSVEVERNVGDFNEKENVLRAWECFAVVVGAVTQETQVRLGFRIVIEVNCALDA
jgi:hypothetical protein